MPKRWVTLTIFAAAVLAAASAWAGPLGETPRAFEPSRGDAQLTRAAGADGRLWAAWSYDAGPETDVAVAVRSPEGTWSDAVFLGSGTGRDEGHPALTVDATGTVYLAFDLGGRPGVALTVLRAGSGTWTAPVLVTSVGTRASHPALAVVGGRLVVSFRTAAGTGLVDLPLVEPEAEPHGIQDGPDILPPTGKKQGGGGAPGGDPFGPA